MAPFIWRPMINLFRSVAEVSEDRDVVYLHVKRTCIPTPRFKKRELNFLMLENTCFIIIFKKKPKNTSLNDKK
jgi:hypothetical protein